MDSLFFRVEIAVKQILCGLDIKIGASVANKECLDWYREWAEKN
jgi:acetoacetyl-CoA synthetase